jgi:hypothetical protein
MTRNVSIMGAADYRHGQHSIPMAVMFAFWGRHIFDAPAGAVGIGYAADPDQRAPLVARFRRLAHEWIEATENMSSIDDIVVHPSYLEIIGMGPSAIPLLLDELERTPHHWFPALVAAGKIQLILRRRVIWRK